jgi:phosphate ABC transporter phosphate-binding protein
VLRRAPALRRAPRRLRLIALCLSTAFTFAAVQAGAIPFSPAGPPAAAAATSFVPITGAGSTWAYPAIHAWIGNLASSGMTINYQENGSSAGRNFFAGSQSDWAASEIPYGVVDGDIGDAVPTSRGFAYMPDVAGGTVLAYNLKINGRRVTNLRLSGKTVAEIFTNKITYWDDPAVKADNPQLSLPHLQITPVVRSDGAGATADFTQWMLATNPSVWQAYCAVVGRTPCTQTSTYPPPPGTTNMQEQPGDGGVATYVAESSSNGAIGYVEYSWALEALLPVAKLLNAAGYYTLPSPGHIAVSLLKDQISTNASDPATYLTQNLSGVYSNMDPRNYELSAYSYLILPTDLRGGMSTAKGRTIGAFGSYLLCLGQTQVDQLGYSALPINLVQDGFSQLARIPGYAQSATPISQCHNPTFSTNGTNTLAADDPQPLACDRQGSAQCAAGVAEPGETGVSITVTSGNSGSTSPGSSNPGSTNPGSTNPGSANPGSASHGGSNQTTGTGKQCDPNTGVCSPASGGTGPGTGTAGNSGSPAGSAAGSGQPSDSPITLSASNDNGLEVTLMALAAGLMFLLSVAPPLIAQAAKRSRQRRGIDEFYGGRDWTGDGK